VARVAWLLRHQWRAYWRGIIRNGNHIQFYLFVLTPLAYLIFIKLPPVLQQAAQDMSTGRTESREFILLLFACAWLFLPFEDAHLSFGVNNLLRFPLPISELLVLRILSLFISPLAVLILLGSLLSLFPFSRARDPLPGLAAALLFFLLAMLLGWCLSHLLSIAAWRKGILAVAVITLVPFGASLIASGNHAHQTLRALLPYTPVHLVTVAATGGRWQSALIPLLLLLAAGSLSPWLLLGWSFRRNLSAVTEHLSAGGGKLDFIRLPGRLGGLVNKELRYYRKTFFPWLGILLTLICSFALLKNAIPPIVLETAILFIFISNLDLISNSFGWDRVPEINRYLLFPLRVSDIVLVKNLGIAIIGAAQIMPLSLLAGWRFGLIIAGVSLIEALALLLAHLAWGNLCSVGYPHKENFYRLSSRGGSNILVVLVGTVIGSLPGVAIIYLTQAGASSLAFKISGILLLTIAGYLGSVYCAGRMFERRWTAILDRLS
jgi:hypothetical protein